MVSKSVHNCCLVISVLGHFQICIMKLGLVDIVLLPYRMAYLLCCTCFSPSARFIWKKDDCPIRIHETMYIFKKFHVMFYFNLYLICKYVSCLIILLINKYIMSCHVMSCHVYCLDVYHSFDLKQRRLKHVKNQVWYTNIIYCKMFYMFIFDIFGLKTIGKSTSWGLAGHDFGAASLGVIRAVSEFALRQNATIWVQTVTRLPTFKLLFDLYVECLFLGIFDITFFFWGGGIFFSIWFMLELFIDDLNDFLIYLGNCLFCSFRDFVSCCLFLMICFGACWIWKNNFEDSGWKW